MNPNDRNDYNPADDDNQGVAQLMAQGEEATDGVSQTDYMSPVVNQGPEPVKEEVNDQARIGVPAGEELPDTKANGVSDDVLAEEDVADGSVEVDND